MAYANCQWMEIYRLIKDDPQANILLEDFFDACFDCVPVPEWAPVATEQKSAAKSLRQMAQALKTLNEHLELCHQAPPQKIQPPAGVSLHRWAEQLAMQLLANGPY